MDLPEEHQASELSLPASMLSVLALSLLCTEVPFRAHRDVPNKPPDSAFWCIPSFSVSLGLPSSRTCLAVVHTLRAAINSQCCDFFLISEQLNQNYYLQLLMRSKNGKGWYHWSCTNQASAPRAGSEQTAALPAQNSAEEPAEPALTSPEEVSSDLTTLCALSWLLEAAQQPPAHPQAAWSP